jgi:ribosomal protein S18 acetylase RimI-like enzyme
MRALRPEDLARVLGIDAAASGRPRRGFFEQRLALALRAPQDCLFTGFDDAGELQGFVLGRLSEGDFGNDSRIVVLDAIGVDPRRRRRGIGRALLDNVVTLARHKGASAVHSQAEWRNHRLLEFFDAAGFTLAPRFVLQLDVGDAAARERAPEPDGQSFAEAGERDYSTARTDDFTRLGRDRVPCRSLEREDLEALVRIDRAVLGYDRRAYHQRRLAEIFDTAGLRASLVAEVDGAITGYVMARVDFGEFGRMEPIGVLDTLGVDPAVARRGVGSALLSQLLSNVAALRIDALRTEVGSTRHALLSFLQHNGFRPSQQLVFTLAL